MAKKSKRNLQKLISKKQQLQMYQSPTITFEDSPTEALESQDQPTPTGSAVATNARPTHIRSELKRTIISIALIAILLVAVVMVDKRAAYLNDFGNWLYQALRLQS